MDSTTLTIAIAFLILAVIALWISARVGQRDEPELIDFPGSGLLIKPRRKKCAFRGNGGQTDSRLKHLTDVENRGKSRSIGFAYESVLPIIVLVMYFCEAEEAIFMEEI